MEIDPAQLGPLLGPPQEDA